MDPLIHSLWLQTALALAGWLVGLVLHLKWHPLRRHLSDAWDLMTGVPWLIVMLAAVSLMAEWLRPGLDAVHWNRGDLTSWRELALPLTLRSAETYTLSLHALFSSWPLAVILPPVLTALAWRLHRSPYRHATKIPSSIEKGFLWIAVVLAWAWIISEIVHACRPMPVWLEAARLFNRMLFSACTMAMSQIFVISLVMAWETPVTPDEKGDVTLAAERTFARWRSVFGLGALDLLWLLWLRHEDIATPNDYARWLLVEAMAIFAPLPVAVTLQSGTWLQQGARAMRLLLRVWLPWLGLIITAVASLLLVLYASAVLQDLTEPGTLMAKAFLPLHALVLATVRSWLFLATVFLFIRHGLKPAASFQRAD